MKSIFKIENNVICPICYLEKCRHLTKSKNLIEVDYWNYSLKKFKSKFLKNQVLNNNGELSYIHLSSSSLSLPERNDVLNFQNFIYEHINSKHVILDIGCGVLSKPGYINFKKNNIHIGLDILDTKFNGIQIKSIAELIPLKDNSVDIIIFATSLDHVISLEDTIKESKRILKNDGKIFVWMSDMSLSTINKIKRLIYAFITKVNKGYNIYKFFVYEDQKAVYYVPSFAVDPYHSYREKPSKVIRKFIKHNFSLLHQKNIDKNQIFMCFNIR